MDTPIHDKYYTNIGVIQRADPKGTTVQSPSQFQNPNTRNDRYVNQLARANYFRALVDDGQEDIYKLIVNNKFMIDKIVSEIGQKKASKLLGINQATLSTILKTIVSMENTRPLATPDANNFTCWEEYNKWVEAKCNI